MLSTYKIETFEDILKALRERPEWLEELRRIILTEELLALPQKFERFRKEEFIPLKESFERFRKEEFIPLKESFERFRKEEFIPLKDKVDRIEQDVSELKGDNFERKVRERAPSYFGRLIRRCKVISTEELANILDNALDRGIITESERDNAINADVVVTGVLKHDREKNIVIVTEVSVKADRIDVERSSERASIIERVMKLPAIAVVIGKEFTEGAKAMAEKLNVILC